MGLNSPSGLCANSFQHIGRVRLIGQSDIGVRAQEIKRVARQSSLRIAAPMAIQSNRRNMAGHPPLAPQQRERGPALSLSKGAG
jgi:hypothetical protein